MCPCSTTKGAIGELDEDDRLARPCPMLAMNATIGFRLDETDSAYGHAKAVALRATVTLNRKPPMIADPLFRVGGFLDARDLLQVHYEMARQHLVESKPGRSYSASRC